VREKRGFFGPSLKKKRELAGTRFIKIARFIIMAKTLELRRSALHYMPVQCWKLGERGEGDSPIFFFSCYIAGTPGSHTIRYSVKSGIAWTSLGLMCMLQDFCQR
jgi:hypothetical protein